MKSKKKLHSILGTIIFSIMLFPLANISSASALTSGLTSPLDTSLSNSSTISNTTTSVTAATNITTTSGSISTGNPTGAPLPNSTTATGASTTVDGVQVFGNGTITTSINGVSMNFLFDPNGPVKTKPTSTLVTITSSDSSGNSITGIWDELHSSSGSMLGHGYTTNTYSVTTGKQYVVYVSNWQNMVFNHWDDGSTNPYRAITPTQSVTLTAYFSTGSTATAPQPPASLAATAVSSSQINLSWNVPTNNGGSAITGYKIERSTNAGSTWSTIVTNTASTSTAFSDIGLAANTSYTYRVSAINSVSTSSPSNTASANTNAATTNGITLNNIQSTSGTVSASPYQITLANFNAGTGSNQLLVVGVSANNNNVASVTFGGAQLTKKVSSFSNNDAEFWYLVNPTGTEAIVVTMKGSTSAIVGAYSFSGVNQSSPLPTSTTNHNSVAGSPTVSITTANPDSWVLDLPSIYGGVTLGSPACTPQWNTHMPSAITGASSSAVQTTAGTVTCKWTASSYEMWDDVAVEVKAYSIGSTTTVSSPPTGLVATAASSSQINLSWTAPTNNGGAAITGYNIERSPDSGSTWSSLVANTGSTTTKYSDIGLNQNTAYTYRVSAINSVGTSSPSNIASATTTGTSSGGSSITQVQSGLVASDSLTNETMTQQQLQSGNGYWAYAGDAPAEKAPYSFSRDTQGLHIGVQAPSSGTWAGFFAESPNTNAVLFHSVITTPVRTVPSQNYENGMYVQTSNGLINYVTCGSLTNTQVTSWVIVNTYGTTNQATNFTVLWMDKSANQPLTRDCTIITNGQNYLKVYLDGTMVYTNSNLNLQMPAPFNTYLEPETSYSGQILSGTFQDYYVSADETIKVVNNPSNAARADIVDSAGNILGSSQVSGETATLDVGKYHYPQSANIKIYDSNNNLIASGPANIYGGNVYSVTP